MAQRLRNTCEEGGAPERRSGARKRSPRRSRQCCWMRPAEPQPRPRLRPPHLRMSPAQFDPLRSHLCAYIHHMKLWAPKRSSDDFPLEHGIHDAGPSAACASRRPDVAHQWQHCLPMHWHNWVSGSEICNTSEEQDVWQRSSVKVLVAETHRLRSRPGASSSLFW